MPITGFGDFKTQVIHIKNKSKYYNRQYVYIGRPSKWGNPFVIGKDGTREEVINKYVEHLNKNWTLILDAKKELKGCILMCYCKPKACHGDILVKLIEDE